MRRFERPAVPDLSGQVRPVLAASPRVSQVVGGYTDGDRFFFAHEQLADIARELGDGPLFRMGNAWLLRVPDAVTLTRWVIHREAHYQFPDSWQWHRHQLPARRRPTTRTSPDQLETERRSGH